MNAVIELINAVVPSVPTGNRCRVWMLLGTAYRFHCGIRIDVESRLEANQSRLMLRYTMGELSRALPAETVVGLGENSGVALVARAIAYRQGSGKPIAVLMEIQRLERIDRIGVGFEAIA
jgi:hypothetical protein